MNKDVASFTIWRLNSGSTDNVIPKYASMGGLIRYFDEEVKLKFKERISSLTKTICEGFNCQYNLEFIDSYLPLINLEKQTQIVHDIAKVEFGENNINTKDYLPLFSSDDFAYFLHKVPGTYIGLNSVKPGWNIVLPHSPLMDFNDNIISTGAFLNIKISEHRLGISLI